MAVRGAFRHKASDLEAAAALPATCNYASMMPAAYSIKRFQIQNFFSVCNIQKALFYNTNSFSKTSVAKKYEVLRCPIYYRSTIVTNIDESRELLRSWTLMQH